MKNTNERIHSVTSQDGRAEEKSDLSTSQWQRYVIPLVWGVQAAVLVFAFPQFDAANEVSRSFSLGSFTIHFYGLILGAAVFVAVLLLSPLMRRRFHDPLLIDRLLLWILPCAFIGARLYFVAFSWDFYQSNWQSVFAVWEGGLAIHGGILGGLVGTWIALSIERKKRKKISFLGVLDMLTPALAIGQAIGRWGNYINQEAFGRPTTLPWKLFIDPPFRPIGSFSESYYHPTFLYESLGTLLLFSILWYAMSRQQWSNLGLRGPGFFTGVYFVGYGILRFFIEDLRMDSLMLGPVRVAQLVSIISVAIGAYLIVRGKKKTPEIQG